MVRSETYQYQSIKSYFSNRHNGATGKKNAFAGLLKNLRKPQSRAPRAKVPWMMWEKEHPEEINAIYEQKKQDSTYPLTQRNWIAQDCFEAADETVKAAYRQRAEEETALEKAQYEQALTGDASQSPEDQAL